MKNDPTLKDESEISLFPSAMSGSLAAPSSLFKQNADLKAALEQEESPFAKSKEQQSRRSQ